MCNYCKHLIFAASKFGHFENLTYCRSLIWWFLNLMPLEISFDSHRGLLKKEHLKLHLIVAPFKTLFSLGGNLLHSSKVDF